MQSEPIWLTADEVVEYNQLVVEATGEPHFVRDRGLVESAVDSIRNHYEYGFPADVADLACTLMLGIARNHPFEQGNKRTGFVAAQAFLEINGYLLNMPDRVWIADMMIDALADYGFHPALVAGIRSHLQRIA